jgi:hypothetical protein
MVATAAAFLCVAGGTVSAAMLVAILWLIAPLKHRFLWLPWTMLVWATALLGSLALLGYGAAVLTQGATSLSAVFFFTGFLICFTISVAAAPRLLLLRYAYRSGNLRAHYVGMVILASYVALVYLWVPGTLMAALTPLLAMMATSGATLLSRRQTILANNPNPDMLPTPHKDALYWALLVFSALAPLVDWALCLAGGRDYWLPFAMTIYVLVLNGYIYYLPAA